MPPKLPTRAALKLLERMQQIGFDMAAIRDQVKRFELPDWVDLGDETDHRVTMNDSLADAQDELQVWIGFIAKLLYGRMRDSQTGNELGYIDEWASDNLGLEAAR